MEAATKRGWPRQWWRPKSGPTLAVLLWLLCSLLAPLASARPYLVFANKKDLRLVEVSPLRASSRPTVVVKQLEDAAAIDFFLQKNKVCWTEISLSVIRCSEIDPMRKGKVKKEAIVDTGLIKPEGLACDWVGDKIYWTDSDTKRIEVSSLPGNPHAFRTVLVWEDLDLPRAIAVAPNDGLMFWTDWGTEYPKIERAGMNGDPATRMILVDKEIAWPNGLTLDYDKKLLYWIEANLRHISVIDWDGRNRRKLFEEKAALPLPFAISVYKSELYWTDWNTNSLHMYNFSVPEGMDASDYLPPLPQKIKLRGKLTPMDIKVFEPMRQRPADQSFPCLRNNGGCSHLCLAAPINQGYSCACPTGIKLINNRTCAESNSEILLLARRMDIRKISLDTPDFSDIVIPVSDENEMSSVAIDYDPVSGFVYWTDQLDGIHRAQLDGSDEMAVVAEEVDHPDGIAVDWVAGNLFWSDTGTDRIEVARLDGTDRRVLISRDLDEPRDLALDPVNGWMYWSDWGQVPRIERAWMDGTHREAIITEDIVWPNGIALDIEGQTIYWCDAQTDRIEMANVDGSGRRVVIDDILLHPFGLSILGDYIYWTDWQENTVERANKLTGENRRVLVGHLVDLMSIQSVRTSPDPGWHNNCAEENNGGCSHLCLMTPSGRVCGCPNGYELELGHGDRTNCIIPEAFLLYTHRSDIGRVSLQTPDQNGYVLPIRGISEASAIDCDFADNRIYWTDVEEKSISRAYVNGSHKEIVVAFGLDFPEGIAVDWVAGNIYWTNTGMNRIEVARKDGTARRVLIWRDLSNPVSIAVDPASGRMYWSTWGKVPVIESAAMDGSDRLVFVQDLGKSNGLTVDPGTQRLYWTDLTGQRIAYASLHSGVVHTIVLTDSPQLYSLALYQNNIFWSDWQSRTIERADKTTGSSRATVQTNVGDIMDLLVFHGGHQTGTNPCAINNGGCPDLCLYVQGGVKCACSSHHFVVDTNNNGLCQEPDEFLLFGQKNKISRLMMDQGHLDEVPDLVLPVHGARDIRSLGYDSVSRTIYWIDHGSKKHKETHRVTIHSAFTNGTLVKRPQVASNQEAKESSESSWMPFDLAIDSFNRLLYWTDESSNSIQAKKLDLEGKDDDDTMVIVSGTTDNTKPRCLAVHPAMNLMFWTDVSPPIRIERSRVDGHNRQTLVNSSLVVPSDLTVDTQDHFLFWADIDLKRIERVSIDGTGRTVVVQNGGVFGPLVVLAIQGQFLFWGTRSQETIVRVDKFTGQGLSVVKARVPHLSSLIAVSPPGILMDFNPCFKAATIGCSHMCLVDNQGLPRCTCPLGSGLVLGADEQTCGLPPTCKPSEFTCGNGAPSCIPLQWRCDGQTECSDHSDEMDCPECGSGQFRCRSGQCINGSLICNGHKNCDDSTDELSCCPEEKFQCTLSGECIDESKTCNGVTDCSDNSDELMPQCTRNNNEEATPLTEASDLDTSSIVVVTVVIIVILAVVAVASFMYCSRYKNSVATEDEQHQPQPEVTHLGPDGCEAAHTLMAGSSNGQTYDRSHVTGASSSTASSHGVKGHEPPPPSPTTTIMQRLDLRSRQQPQQPQHHSLPRRHHQNYNNTVHQQHHHHHHHSQHRAPHRERGPASAYRHYKSINQPPPPTPASTDFNDESEASYGHSRLQFLEANYDSEAYIVSSRPHPPTPRSQYLSDYGCEEEDEEVEDTFSCPPSPINEGSVFLNPPPSRVPTPTIDL